VGRRADGGDGLGALAATLWRVRRSRNLAVLLPPLKCAQEASAQAIVHPYQLCVRPTANLLVARAALLPSSPRLGVGDPPAALRCSFHPHETVPGQLMAASSVSPWSRAPPPVGDAGLPFSRPLIPSALKSV